jgi:acylphosphatase
MIKHFNITVSGKVQGVFFRAGAMAEAQRLGLTGFVSNQANGDLYIEVEGKSDGLTHFLEWCSHGPEKAEVKGIQIVEAEPTPLSGFEIRK